MSEAIYCPRDLNRYLIAQPLFENTFSDSECEKRKFYGDCYHCFSTSIVKRDKQIKETRKDDKESGNSYFEKCCVLRN